VRPVAAIPPAVDVAQRVVAWWRAFMAERKEMLLLPLRLLRTLSNQFHSSAMGNVLGIGVPSSGAGGYGAHDRHELLQRRDLLVRLHPPVCPAPSRPPLLALLEDLPYLFEKEVLERLDPVDRTMLEQVWRPWLAAVLTSGLPRLPKGVWVRLRLREFCTSAERLAWARANRCPWTRVPSGTGEYWRVGLCELATRGGHLDALRWAQQRGCPWGTRTCSLAAAGGHVEVLQWARQSDCPWDAWACYAAAAGGHVECCSGRGRTAARGSSGTVWPLPGCATPRLMHGCGSSESRMNASITHTYSNDAITHTYRASNNDAQQDM